VYILPFRFPKNNTAEYSGNNDEQRSILHKYHLTSSVTAKSDIHEDENIERGKADLDIPECMTNLAGS